MSLSHHSVALAAAALLATGGCNLQCNGPTTIIPVKIKYGGRAVAIATNPADDKAALVVSESGGIFQTRNSGSPWFQITGSNTFWFSDAHYFDGDPNILLATAYQDMKTANGGGVWRSTSGGAGWTHVPITPPDTTKPFEAYAIAVEPSNPLRIWVGTSQGLISSTDEGVTWTFQQEKSNFAHEPVYCVLAPSPNHLRVITEHGFHLSDDGGATWTQSNQGHLPFPRSATHNSLACSPANDEVVYWCGFVVTDVNVDPNAYETILTRTMDGGVTWEPVWTSPAFNRAPFVRATPRALSGAGKYQVYYGDGQAFMGRLDVNKSDERHGDWQDLSIDHWDNSDIGFRDDGFTPWLLAGDGGLQTTTDKGATWKMAGNGNWSDKTGPTTDGYDALQISDATGQAHAQDRQSDLYFGTQDNMFWASADNGSTWPHSAPTEGMHLEVRAERSATEDDNRINMINSSPPSVEFIAAPQLSNLTVMKVPVGAVPPAQAPIHRIGEQTYVTWLPPSDTSNTQEIWTSYNNGALWFDRTQAPGFADARDRVKMVNGTLGPVLFYSDYFRDTQSHEITRAFDLVGNGTPFFATVTNFGTLTIAPALVPTGSPIVWDELYAVDPFDPDHMLVVDSFASVVRVTWDGGETWNVDSNLKTVITNRGMYKFQAFPKYGIMQISTIAFDPRQRGRILVGTVQAGVVYSCNFGQTWRRLEDSENIPNVSSFYFPSEDWVLASSYGRGLWRLTLSCPAPTNPPPVFEHPTGIPLLVTNGAAFPLGNLIAEPRLSFMVARGGDITGYQKDKTGKQVESIGVTSGSAEGLTMSGEKAAAMIPVQTGAVPAPDDPKLTQLLKQGFRIKGICLEGRLFKGYVLSKNEIAAADLPKPRVPGPTVVITLSGEAGRRVVNVRGVRFEPGKVLQVLVNDQPLSVVATAGREGGFKFNTSVPPFPGHYELTVRQTGDRGPLSASAFYEITQSD